MPPSRPNRRPVRVSRQLARRRRPRAALARPPLPRTARSRAGTLVLAGLRGLRPDVARRDVLDGDLPLVVLGAPLPRSERRLLAGADHAANRARRHATGAQPALPDQASRYRRRGLRLSGTGRATAWPKVEARRGRARGRCPRPGGAPRVRLDLPRQRTGHTWRHLPDPQDGELLAGHGVEILLSQEALLDQVLDVGRRRTRELPLIQGQRVGVLLEAEQQFLLALPLLLLTPHGHGDGHQDQHDGDPDEQDGHRVAARV